MSTTPLLSPSPSLQTQPQEDLEANSRPSIRQHLRHFFTTQTFHYSVLVLVALDVACMFADIIIDLETCSRGKSHEVASALEALKYTSLVFSSIFMLELLLSMFAFGKSYFSSTFHIFDAAIILTSFIFEISLQGIEEEVASLIVVLRLLRVVKIVDEISVGAEQKMTELEERCVEAEEEVKRLREEVRRLRNLGSE
ncbi:hypothetical protein P280DRAFT_467776 [Massarina eburnea CBS 473.64]|uniref:Voltage-gated hydrogen channel 1 n=1 Tax=Massarina eburnea CBS 473.64 TaxID=1395130 RepID=A0A6A6S4A5_9PLEO|nr:hypothetical protein P280DRAFT_467776 [Massarina eburnea CBS 473.64]